MLWLAVGGDLISIPLRIPREFYLHLRTPAKPNQFSKDMYSSEKVTRGLPRERPCVNLYKISVREDVYISGQEHFIDLTNDPNVDGVYELQVRSVSLLELTHL